MKKTLRIACFAVVGLLGLQDIANAFWSSVVTVHQDMTARALNQSIYSYSGITYSFSQTAVDGINGMHTIADSDPYDPRDHFDSERLIDGFALLVTHRQKLMTELGKPSPSSAVAWAALGLMLHQIQDFYAHSSYVEHTGGSGAIIDFGSATNAAALQASPNGKAPVFIQSSGAIGTVCASDALTLLTPTSSQVTTGYYPPNSPPSGKCQHGAINGSFTGSVAVSNCAQTLFAGTVVKDGINKDHPCVTSLADKLNHAAAKALAEQETESFVKSIAADLSSAGNAKGFCTLLGLPMNAAPCNGPSNLGNYQTFIKYTVDNVAFGPIDPCTTATSASNACGAFNGGNPTQSYIRLTVGQNDNPPGSGGPYAYLDIELNSTQLVTLSSNGASLSIAQVTGPTLTYPLSTNTDPPSSSGMLNAATVGFTTSAVVSSPPTGYPATTLLSSASYLARNATAQPGTVTLQMQAVPISPTPVFTPGSLVNTAVANIYASGSFDFWVADPVVTGTLNIGPHEVKGTYLVNAGQCMSFDGKTMSCGLGNDTY